MLTTYDWHGNYGHPDHIQVHQVGHRAAELAGTPAVYEATLNRDAAFAGIAEAVASGEWVGDAPDVNDTDDGEPFGTPEAELTTAVDVERRPRPEAGGVRVARQPGDRHRVLPADDARGLPEGLRHRVVPARGRTRRSPRGLARRPRPRRVGRAGSGRRVAETRAGASVHSGVLAGGGTWGSSEWSAARRSRRWWLACAAGDGLSGGRDHPRPDLRGSTPPMRAGPDGHRGGHGRHRCVLPWASTRWRLPARRTARLDRLPSDQSVRRGHRGPDDRSGRRWSLCIDSARLRR